MDGLSNHPLLQAKYISKVLDNITPDQESFYLTSEVPFRTQEGREVRVDVRQRMGGMTMAAAEGAESPIIEKRGLHQWVFEPAHWREKVLLSEKDTVALRRIGTIGEFENAQRIVNDIVGQLRMRIENRLEWSKWQMVMGSLAINQKDIQYTIDYHIPARFTPTLTGVNRWDQASTDPLSDILDWLEMYRDEGPDPAYMIYNGHMEKVLLLNDTMRDLRDSLFVGQSTPAMLSRDNIRMIFNAYTGLEPRVYDKGYWLVAGTLNQVTAGATSITVDDASGMEIGDFITLVHKNGEFSGRDRTDITNIVGNVLTVTALTSTATFPVGSEVRVKKQFLPDNKFIIRGSIPQGTTGGPEFAEFISTQHVYGPGGIMAPRPGLFSKVLNKEDDDPPHVAIIAGVSGLPVLYHTTTNVVATPIT